MMDALTARIEARKAKDTSALREAASKEKKSKAKKATVTVESTPAPVIEAAPWEADVAPKAAKVKATPKPRAKAEPKPAAESLDISAMVARITQKATDAANKSHKAEVAKLNAEHKTAISAQISAAVAAAKVAKATALEALKTAVSEAEKKAYAAGLKAGEASARRAFTAAMKGV
jgi:ribonuclease E